MNKFLFLFIGCFIMHSSFAQHPWELGGEYMKSIGKGYKANLAGARYETYPGKNSWSVGITRNFSSKESYSLFRGVGICIGYRHAFSVAANGSSPFAGLRICFAFQNYEGKTNANDLTITPMAEAGYHLKVWKRIFGTPALGYGYTIKLSHDYNSLQEDAGGRFLPSLGAGYRF